MTAGTLRDGLHRWIDRFVPAPDDRPDRVLKQRVLVGCAVALAVAAALFGLHAWRLQGELGGATIALWVGAGLALCAPPLLRATGSSTLPGTLLCVEFSLLLGVVALYGNGFDGAVLIWAPAVPLLAAFLVGSRVAAGLALWTSVEVAALFWLDTTGALTDTFGPEAVVRIRLAALVSGIALVTFVGWLYESQTLRGLLRVNRELVEAKERAEASERLKSALLMNMSHEVRTPLTSVLGAAELLRDEAPPELADLAAMVHAGGHRMLDTLTAVLDLARLESDVVVVRPRPFGLAEIVDQSVAAARLAAARKGLHLAVDLGGPDAPTVAADPALARRVLGLLLDNAVKFTEAGRVTVRVRAHEGSACVDVVDTGIGMCPSFLPRAFDAFEQESGGMGRSHEGSGLGLTVAQRLAVLQGGTLTAESRQGEGSTFTLRLPLAAAEPALSPLRLLAA